MINASLPPVTSAPSPRLTAGIGAFDHSRLRLFVRSRWSASCYAAFRQWGIYDDPFDNDYLNYESPEDWAYIIYYGHDSQWWNKNKDELKPKLYQP